jgi:hypothetical protein
MEAWLAELGIAPVERAERDGVSSWDLVLDGRRRRVRMTLILDPAVALVASVHYAPPLTDHVSRTHRQLLHWNDELPFVKFSIAEDGRPMLSAELAADLLERDAVGLLMARLVAVCDFLSAESAKWAERLGPPPGEPSEAGVRLLERYAASLGELAGGGG